MARYFLSVGGVLLALLFISDAYLPKLPVAHSVEAGLPLIRVHTDRKWPERVVFDTSHPVIIPAQIANMDASVQAPATLADVAPKAQVREALAQMQPSDSRQLKQSEPRNPEAKLQGKRKSSKRRASPPMVLVARQPQFGWFSNRIW